MPNEESPKVVSPAAASRMLAPWREAQKRIAYRPVVKRGDGDPLESKYSGTPWISKDEDWPMCGYCSRPFQLMLQLNLDQLPESLRGQFGSGLLQFFYCRYTALTNQCDDFGAEEYGVPISLCRIVHPKGPGRISSVPKFKGSYPPFPAKTIVGWKEFSDYPSLQENERLGMRFNGTAPSRMILSCAQPQTEIVCDVSKLGHALPDRPVKGSSKKILSEYEINVRSFWHSAFKTMAARVGQAAEQDKLGGWPHWYQGANYARCKKCRRTMQMVFQSRFPAISRRCPTLR